MTNYNIAYLSQGLQGYAPVQQATSNLPIPVSQHIVKSRSVDMYLKVLCPENKKDFKTITLRGLNKEYIDTPDKLKTAISMQYEGLDSENMEVGYFIGSKKLWINSRLDINDVWDTVEKGEKLTLWCLDSTPRESQKRKHDEHAAEEDSQPKKKCPQQSAAAAIEERRSKAKANEEKLKELHKDKWSPFQYKLWGDMLANGTYKSFEEPPVYASMFSREEKRSHTLASDATSAVAVSGMVMAMNSLCEALIPKEKPQPQLGQSTMASPMKNAQLRGMYMKQLNDLRQLYDGGIVNKEEYEEQRSDLVKLMQQLGK